VRHVARVGEVRNAYTILVRKPEAKSSCQNNDDGDNNNSNNKYVT
jgi:hypothetical protein